MEKKEFNVKAYGIIVIIVMTAVLSLLTVRTFVTRYNAFDPEKVATAYVDTIVQTGDGYNAFKNSLLSKNSKFGDFIRQNYIYPAIYDSYKPGESTKGLKGLNDEELKGEKTKSDNGSLEGKLIEKMYPYFLQLIESNSGWDNYDYIFTSYINELKTQRRVIFGDSFFDDETFFTCIESNIKTYGDSLTGTEDVFDKNTNVQTSFASVGAYEEKYGDDYKLTVSVKECKNTDIIEGYAKEYNIEDGCIKEEKIVTLKVECDGKTVADDIQVYVVKIGRSWFVDNLATNTSILYTFYK